MDSTLRVKLSNGFHFVNVVGALRVAYRKHTGPFYHCATISHWNQCHQTEAWGVKIVCSPVGIGQYEHVFIVMRKGARQRTWLHQSRPQPQMFLSRAL